MKNATRSLEKQLLAYSAAASAALALAPASEAEVVVTNINLTLTSSGQVDLFVGESQKFQIGLQLNSEGGSRQLRLGIQSGNEVSYVQWRGSSYYAQRLAKSSPVMGTSFSWTNSAWSRNMAFVRWNRYDTNAPWTLNSAQGSWVAQDASSNRTGTNGFLGLRFSLDGGNTYNHGWAAVDLAADFSSVTIGQFAYETAPDTDLPAGVVPEPSSLSLLALGAAGLLAFRKARKTA